VEDLEAARRREERAEEAADVRAQRERVDEVVAGGRGDLEEADDAVVRVCNFRTER
jgi:hypothetical protein